MGFKLSGINNNLGSSTNLLLEKFLVKSYFPVIAIHCQNIVQIISFAKLIRSHKLATHFSAFTSLHIVPK